ncbi:MAG: DUF433 domain-containing protein [Anaerolineales bacterium]|nr:DUF433 domain-containing protein [Anaerolineales bacterium]
MFTHIAYDNEILNGKPHIVGTRLSIEFILELFASGATKDEVIKSYPQLTAEAVEDALKYAAQFSETAERVLSKNAELYKRLS